MDAQFVADTAELACRWVFAALYLPEQPDAFWADLHAGFVAEADMCLNAFAVMADWNHPIGTES